MHIVRPTFHSVPLQSGHALQMDAAKILAWRKELLSMPPGSLYLSSYRGRICFIHALEGTRRSISKDTNLIYRLARKRYLQLLLGTCEQALMQIHQQTGLAARRHLLESDGHNAKSSSVGRRNVSPAPSEGSQDTSHRKRQDVKQLPRSSNPIESLLLRYQEAGLELLRITCSQKQYEWVKAPYRRNRMDYGDETFETYSGIIMRSKSERDIGNRLEVFGVPYRPEMEIELEVDWMEGVNGAAHGKYKRYYPDFAIPSRDGKLLIWEHLGLASKEGYRIHNMEKLAAYRQGGLCDDAHLILTFERDMVNLDIVDEIIRQRILPLL